MKKYLIILMALTITLTSCTKPSNNIVPDNSQPIESQPQLSNDSNNQDENKDTYFGQYQMSEQGFSEYVKDNRIDKDYEVELTNLQESPGFSTQSWIELENKYIKIWDKELNNVYRTLLKKLNEKEQKELIEAQKGWLQFHTKETDFVSASWEDLGLGSMGRVQLVISAKGRIRERTLQLMEYYYMLNGDVEFLYKGSKE